MKRDTTLAVLWRHKGVIATTFLVFALTAAVISKTLGKVYATEATLLISLPADTQTFDTVQASQALARSYADIIDSQNIAQLVAVRLGDGTTKGELRDATDFEPLSETQLLKVRAEDPKPERAKLIADTYAQVFIEYAKANLQETTKARISLADRAPLLRQPARPKPTLYTLVASILGLALGVALAFLRDRLDQRLRTPEDVESEFDQPVLARVPRRGRTDASVVAFREAYRVLRTNVDFASVGKRLKSIGVTSGGESEGKTTTVTQLALASAELGQRVIAVEGDFRRPTLEKELMPEREEPLSPGLSNYLVEAASLEEVIHPTDRPNVSIVPPGPLPPNPAVLLGTERGRTAIRALLSHADLVVVDTPPLNVGVDASVVSGMVDGVLMVVDLDSAKDGAVRAGIRQLEAVKAPLLGLVLNRDRSAEVSTYEYYVSVTPSTSDGSPKARERGQVSG